jgi:uncharacterized membrane protein (UPF0127 family)
MRLSEKNPDRVLLKNSDYKDCSMLKKISLTLLLLFFFSLLSCQEKEEGSLEETTLRLKNHKITVELARTLQERQTGLMNRKKMDNDRGMLFIFEKEEPRSFWMKNTYIPLSIAYINREGIIIDIHDMSPLDTTPVASSGPAKYALEVNRGMFDLWEISVGYQIDLKDL